MIVHIHPPSLEYLQVEKEKRNARLPQKPRERKNVVAGIAVWSVHLGAYTYCMHTYLENASRVSASAHFFTHAGSAPCCVLRTAHQVRTVRRIVTIPGIIFVFSVHPHQR